MTLAERAQALGAGLRLSGAATRVVDEILHHPEFVNNRWGIIYFLIIMFKTIGIATVLLT